MITEPNDNLTIIENLKRLNRPFWVLFAGTFVNRFGTFVLTFLALYLKTQNLTAGEIATAVSSYGAGALIASFLGGYLSDRIGRRKTIALSLFGAAVFTVLLAHASTFPLLMLFTFLTGLSGALYHPAAQALVADLIPEKERLFAYAILRFGINTGWACGMIAGGFMAQRSYIYLFYGDAITSIIFGVLALIALPKVRGMPKEEAAWGDALSNMRNNRAFLGLILGNFAISMVFIQTATAFGPFIVSGGFTSDVYGYIMGLNGILIMCFELSITRITRRIAPAKAIAVGFFLIGGGFSINALGPTLPVLITAMVILTLGEMIALPVVSSFTSTLAPEKMRGRYMGVSGFTWSLATFLGPMIGLRLVENHSVILWSSCAVFGIIGAAVVCLSAKAKTD
jgi:MFS family permease